MNENSKSKVLNVLDSLGGVLPYLVTFEFPLCFAMLVTFLVKMAGMQGDFFTALGFLDCFALPILWVSAFKTVLQRLDESKSKWKNFVIGVTAFCALFAIVFGVILVKQFDSIVAKL